MNKEIIKIAIKTTMPVFFGYIFMGMAFGLLFAQAGFNVLWSFFMCTVVFAGTAQFLAVDFLHNMVDLATIAVTTLLVNFRHVVYGISFLERFRTMGISKFFMIFGLTDETYALLCAERDGEMWNNDKYLFAIAFLNYLYWITGGVLGTLIGNIFTFDTTGIDFAMTALFIVICVEQQKKAKTHIPAYIGLLASVLSFIFFENMLIPSVLIIVVSLVLFRKKIEQAMQNKCLKD